MGRGEKRELKKSIKELPGPNLERVAEIIRNHYAALGREMPDEVLVNMEEEVRHQEIFSPGLNRSYGKL